MVQNTILLQFSVALLAMVVFVENSSGFIPVELRSSRSFHPALLRSSVQCVSSIGHRPFSRLFLSISEEVASDQLSYDENDCLLEDCDVPADDESNDDVFMNHDDSDSLEEEQRQQQDPLLEEFEAWSRAIDQAIKSTKKKQQSLQSEWEKAQGVESTVARGQLLVNNLYLFSPGVTSATVQDWENGGAEVELTLDPKYESASAEADALFAQARKLKRGSQVVGALLEETSDALELLEETKMDLESAQTQSGIDEGRLRLIQDRLKRTSCRTKFQTPSAINAKTQKTRTKPSNPSRSKELADSGIRKLTSPGGCPVLVGRNRRGNEYLTFNVARGRDVWMHSRGCPGAHVLIQVRRGGAEPTDACLDFAANIAVFYSDARSERRAPVTVAEPKHLLKPRGAPLGAVKLRQEMKVIMGRPDAVPETLKLARDESGLTDEYHFKDKAKHRKKTKEVAKQNQAKRRAEQRAKRKRRANRTSNDSTST